MIYSMNLAQLPVSKTVDFLVWIIDNKIGNYQSLSAFIASDEKWHHSENIPFKCSELEAILVMLRWS